MTMFPRLSTAFGLTIALSGAAVAEDVTVFAAASLGTALDEIADIWTAETGDAVTLSYAGSSALARQIEQGAPADLTILSSDDWMDVLEAAGAVVSGTRVSLLSNSLVLVGAADAAPFALSDLPERLGEGRLAMALTEAVPAGIYGRAALSTLDLWDAVAPRVVEADNVRAALALVALGAVEFGVVYASDAVAEPAVAVLARFPADSHPPIRYPAALVTGGDAGAGFLAFLQGPEAAAIFTAQGFGVGPGPEG